ncbi:MAG: transporter [Gammaproteobacteria bacterium]|nr:transporter [Gammaproteobacteria bacterium]
MGRPGRWRADLGRPQWTGRPARAPVIQLRRRAGTQRQGIPAWRAAHPVGTSAGIALDVQLPLGRYDEDKLINLGQNRYVFRPQLGVLQHTRAPGPSNSPGPRTTSGK